LNSTCARARPESPDDRRSLAHSPTRPSSTHVRQATPT
jgi:hypothetical protein